MVPGGDGAFDAMLDPDVVAFVRRQAEHATWVTSVCTGAFVLGAAGLLAGKRATTHWASKPMLAAFGAQPVDARSSSTAPSSPLPGCSAGIDMALWLAAELAGQSAAEAIQLQIEYDPQPPFDAGSAERADAVVVTGARAAAEEARGDEGDPRRRSRPALTRTCGRSRIPAGFRRVVTTRRSGRDQSTLRDRSGPCTRGVVTAR